MRSVDGDRMCHDHEDSVSFTGLPNIRGVRKINHNL